MDALLNLYHNYYYNIDERPSFQRPEILYRTAKPLNENVTRKNLKEWYDSQKTYLVYKTLKRKYFKNPIVSKTIDHIWNIDLIELSKPAENDGYRFFLTVIDNLSKFAWIRRLTNKRRQTVVAAFQDIIEQSGRKPQIVGCDFGPEFNNNIFKNYCENENIKIYMLYAPDKATLVERFNQTLKFRIYRYLYYNNTSRFIDIIDQIVDNYNHSQHSRTKFKPVDVNQDNQRQVFRNLYRNRYVEQEKQKFFVGDRVLIPYYIETDPTKMTARFRRLKYKDFVYTVSKVMYRSPRYKYLVENNRGEQVRNSFYADQLVKANLPADIVEEEQEEDGDESE